MTGWFGRRSLRSRLMVVGLAGVAGALLVGGIALYAAMGAALDRATTAEAASSAHDVALLVDDGRLPEPVPVSGAQLVQVLDPENRVVGSSVTADRLTPLVDPSERRLVSRGSGLRVPGSRAGLSGELQVAGVEAGPATARVLVVAAVPTADLDTSRRVLRTLMLVLLPLFLALIGVVAWRVIGSALRPVESLRQGAQRIGTAADPTERLPVPDTGDEVSALATTLNAMLARLASAGVVQRSFVADAAHELRSPLASMRTQLEVAARVGEGGPLPDELLPEVIRLSALVDDLLVLARSGTDGTLSEPTAQSVAQLMVDTERRHALARVPVRVRPSGGPADATVVARPDDLTRAVGNLVDNAVRHAATRVTLSWEQRGNAVLLAVTDDGHGISEADRERVFDRFTRLDEARDRDSGGSGLGLAITRELLRRNGARVWLEDAAPGVRAVVAFDRAGPGRSAGG
ncbi:signal transduction histidine kinase [Phycicoccus badiiscoriae]|uniref:histidine kinase n=1 Tax=Pedococcus badiiscoriae TaxID=642776 RepID=A0A852WMT4_9MICO|nr:ATP-binding protein [Pedococcus badiiscoriae]NYG06726.1 signal transduction histidine kinase [Pedococcus badiiscoriae]